MIRPNLGSVLLALPVRFQNALKHARKRTNCVFISDWGSAQDSARGAYDAGPNPLVDWGRGKPLAQALPCQCLWRLASSSSATQVQYAPPKHLKTISWIRGSAPEMSDPLVKSKNKQLLVNVCVAYYGVL